MKTQQEWFDEYAVSHQNETNKAIHYICVPVIFFSIIGLLMSINPIFLMKKLHFLPAYTQNWAFVILIPILLFYLKLSTKSFIAMLLFSLSSLLLNYYVSMHFSLLYISITLFIIAWIGQFYGHHIEGKKPSFFKDLQFLLIGPIWVFQKMIKFS